MSTQSPYPNYGAPAAHPPKSNSTLLLIIILIGGGFLGLACCGVLAGLLLPAVNQARAAARKMADSNDIRQIGLALLEYEQANGSLPPAYTVDASGRKLHSWRTLILPYLDQAALYQSIDLNKPWDAPENAKFHATVIPQFASHTVELTPGETLYRVVVHPQGIFSGSTPTSYRDVTDGVSNTILVVQAAKDQATPWMRPEDYTLGDFLKVTPSNSTYFDGYTHIATADGSIKAIGIQQIGPQKIESLVIINDGGPNMQGP